MISFQRLNRGPRTGKLRFRNRKGAVVVLAAILMIVMLAMVAFVVDIGYLVSAKTEMQRTADAAALAAAWEMVNDKLAGNGAEAIEYAARNKAAEFAAANEVMRTSPKLNLATDVTVGYLQNPADRNEQISFPDPSNYNTVQVRVRYTDEQNQPVSFFFAPVLGIDSQGLSVLAAASFTSENTVGFRAPRGNAKSTLMPFAIKVEDWNGLVDSIQGTDEWAYDPETGTVSPGQDGINELRMFPQKEVGGGADITPGNFGTVDIGSADNSTADLTRQILDGPSAEDFSHYDNGVLELDPQTKKLYISGDTGISASIGNHAIQHVVGHSRTIFLYESVQYPGNNAQFTIVGFAGVRVMKQSLHGGNQYVIIQPSMVADSGAVVGDTNTSFFVGPPVQLVR